MGLDGSPGCVSSGQSPHRFEAPASGCHSGNENTGRVDLFSGSESTGNVRMQVWYQVAAQEGAASTSHLALCPFLLPSFFPSNH